MSASYSQYISDTYILIIYLPGYIQAFIKYYSYIFVYPWNMLKTFSIPSNLVKIVSSQTIILHTLFKLILYFIL